MQAAIQHFLFAVFLVVFIATPASMLDAADLNSQSDFQTHKISNTTADSQITLRPFLRVPMYDFQLEPHIDSQKSKDQGEGIKYEANVNPEFGLTFIYDGIKISYAQTLDSSDEEKQVKGQTKYKDYQLSYFDGNWGLALAYEDYRGFYIEDDTSQQTQQQPQLRKNTFAVSGFYIPFAYEIDQRLSLQSQIAPNEHADRTHSGFWKPGYALDWT